MSRTEEFLERYKTLEKTVSRISALNDAVIYTYESSELCMNSDKLRLCRMLRNYIQHNADYEKFVSISSGMIGYLEKENAYALRSVDKASDEMSKPRALKGSDKVLESAKKLTKANFLPIVDDKRQVIGIFSDRTLRVALVGGADKRTTFSSMKKSFEGENIPTVSPDTPMAEISEPSLVIDSKNGKYLGIVTPKWND